MSLSSDSSSDSPWKSLGEDVSHLRSCQCGHVQNNISRQVLAGIHHSISQNQPALCISVVDLHRPSG